jgi:hypothetical protein
MGVLGMTLSYVLFSILHFIQLVLAIAVIGLYGTDIDRAHRQGKYTDGKWVCEPRTPGFNWQQSQRGGRSYGMKKVLTEGILTHFVL